MHIGKRIKYIRQSKKMSQAAVCSGLLSPSHYSNIEKGRHETTPEILQRIARRLDVPEAYITDYKTKSSALESLLVQYENSLRGHPEDADGFLTAHEEELRYLPSLEQEFRYLLLSCAHMSKKHNDKAAEEIYDRVMLYMENTHPEDLPKLIRFNFYYVTGLIHLQKREYSQSYNSFKKASEHTYNQFDEIRILSNCALIFFTIMDVSRCIFYAEQSRKLALEMEYWSEAVKAFVLLGIMNIEQKNYSQAEFHMLEGIKIAENYGFLEEKAMFLQNLGIMEAKKENYSKSISYCTQSLEIKEHKLNPGNDPFIQRGMFMSYASLLETNLKQGDLDEFARLLQKKDTYTDNDGQVQKVLAYEAKRDLKTGEPGRYEKKMAAALQYFYKHEAWDEIEEFAHSFSEYLSSKRQYKKAFEYMKMDREALINKYKYRL